MSAEVVLVVAILGAVLGLDVVSFPQAMLSRPIVACTVSASLLGAPAAGLLLGAIAEMFALETLPVGASRYPEWGSSSAVGGALISAPNGDSAGGLLIALVATLSVAWFGGRSMVELRRLNAAWARDRHEAIARGSRGTVIGLQLYGMTADLLRGALLAAVGLMVFWPFQQRALASAAVDSDAIRSIVVAIATIAAAGATWKVFHVTLHTRWFFAAGTLGSVAWLVLR